MKAEELMVGDWVYAIDINGEKHPCRANNLEYDYTNKRGDFCVDFYGTGYEVEWPDITFNVEPIPITPEILEKNGFEKLDFSHFQIGNRRLVLDADGRWDGPLSWNWVVTEMDTNAKGQLVVLDYYVATINYVHELQHALRLCGIEKEIVL